MKITRFIQKYFITIIIIIFFWLKYLFYKRSNLNIYKRILIIRLWGLWSSILTFPMIKFLKDKWYKLDLLATSNNYFIFKNQWYFDKIYNIFNFKDLIKLFFMFKKYDIVIDTEEYYTISTLFSLWLWKITIWYWNIKIRKIWYNIPIEYNDKQHAVLTYMDLLKPLWFNYIPKKLEKLVYTEDDKTKVDEFLLSYKWKKKIAIHTWASEKETWRLWNLENWIKLIEMIKDKYYIFLTWTKLEKENNEYIISKVNSKNVIDISWKFNIFELAYFLEKIDLMISVDTWPMHLAAAMGTKTIGLFWPNLPQRFWPYPLDKNISLYKWDGKAYINVHLGEFKSSDNINKITPEEVYEAILKLI